MPRKLVAGLGAIILFVAAATTLTNAYAATCRNDPSKVTLSKGKVIQLSTYSCRSDRDSQIRIRVQVQRLTELAPGALLNGGTMPWTDALYGRYRIFSNDVLSEYRQLIAKFGSAVRHRDAG